MPYENNAKKHPAEQVEYIANSLKQFGWKQPLVITSDNIVIVGHGRLLGAKKLGLETAPCIIADDLTEDEIKAYRLADNKLNESEWDLDLLDFELGEIELDMSEFGFDLGFGEDEPQEIVEDDFDEEPPEEPKSKLGDIYQLGRHRLMCGDSTDPAVIDRLMDGVKADMVFTDPPYGMKKESEGVLNDNLNYDDLLDFNRQWIPLTFGALKDNGSWYCWGIDEPLMDIYSNILKPMQKENKITFRNLITWNKSYLENGNTFNPFGASGSKGLRMYPIADEKCLFVMCGVQRFNTNQDNYFEEWEPVRSYLEKGIKKIGESDKKIANALGYKDGRTVNHWWSKSQWAFPTEENFKVLQEYAKSKGISIFENANGIKAEYEKIKAEYEKRKAEYEKRKAEYYSTRAYFDNVDCSNNVWNIEITKGKEKQDAGGHATPKPIALCSRAIKSSSREGEIVLDVFGGSGSTLIACEQLNRKCYMCELDPHYVDVIIARWEKFTGEKTVKLN